MFIAENVAVEIIFALKPVVETLERRDRSLADQARRAATSIALNVAEGGRRRGKDRVHLFRIAAGSAAELRVALRVAQAWGYVEASRLVQAQALLDRELGLLWGLTRA